ncbi:hypothetical protein C1631_004840 [Chryseobacterium phosphatilyticum]|uniref:Uncharacterized protein n=1 Tax=Chryseobacterium phosphatilyticum TaxID=475075 RepID=A0A316XGS0_9FLAO|nr:hypothetical protein [Chryseobacterium phosphatilyticum]PWN71946.1 hypothetical protein C1631_004840 [Chryseobacterium phosphatilyticum]
MDKGLVCKEDILQGIRKSALTDNLDVIKYVYVEHTGEITIVKRDNHMIANAINKIGNIKP